MKLLAIDTSTKFLNIAVIKDEAALASFKDTGDLRHSDLIIPAIDGALKKCGFGLRDIDAIALSIGPGSFTGLRIGVATAKAINLALGIPIVSVPTLDAIAHNFMDEKEKILCPLLDAKKNKVYACLYAVKESKLDRLTDYILQEASSFINGVNRPTLVFGDGAALYGDYCEKNKFIEVSQKEWFPKAETVAKIGLAKAERSKFDNADRLVPMYLHSQYCQIKGHKG